MSEGTRLFQAFIDAFERGEVPEPDEFILRAGTDAEELAVKIAAFVDAASPPPPAEGARRRAALVLGFAEAAGVSEEAEDTAEVEGRRLPLMALLDEWVRLPAERALERTQRVVAAVGGMEVAPSGLALRSAVVTEERISVGLEAPHRDLGVGNLEIDRGSGEVLLRLTNIVSELRGTRPYLIFPLVNHPDSPRLRWSGAGEGLPDGVVRVAKPIDIYGYEEVRIGVLESPSVDAPRLLTHFFFASDLEVMGDLHLPYRED